MKFRAAITVFLMSFFPIMAAQPAVDTLLFTIALNDDTTSIYGCQWNDKVSSTLAGPVLMAGKHLLFYSQNGYVLYNESGKLLDSYSLHRKNKALQKKGELPLHLAYPLDSLTLILYRKSSDGTTPDEIFLKKIFKKSIRKVSTSTYDIYKNLKDGQLFNLAANSITDEMGRRNFLFPLLVGYTALEGGTRWWSIDRLYSFTSPLIVEDHGICNSFFPGLKSDQKSEIPAHQIEPLGVYKFQNRWYYVGIASSMGNTEDTYYQVLVLCDQAGNLLYSSKLIKQEISEALLQYVKSNNTNYTVRRAVRHVFVPAIDRQGDICYGMIDFEKKNITVYRRMFLRYRRRSGEKLSDKVFAKANEIAYTPLLLDCSENSGEGVLPEITRLTDDGFVALDKAALKRNGYYVTVHRITDTNLKTKLSRTQSHLPKNVQRAQDSIASLISAWCPYSVALNHDSRGRLNFLHYGFHDELLSTRVLSVTASGDVFVRVDCEKWAEVVQFGADGSFINRFTFNEQEYANRKDLVVVGKNGNVAELDFESKDEQKRKFIWRMMSADSRHSIK
ncbi:MAG: hypothetical protein JW863_22890 [Chitinispirillaceae bacterium]|nr:hypothetical protein [Chitinispirillaceae bacterium]